jgi:cell division protein FtsZ
MAEVKPTVESFAKIKVVGVGGSGGSALNRMIESGVKGVEFIAINTDVQALHYNKASRKIHIGKNITRGLGAGMNPELGRQAAEEAQNEVRDALKDANMVFVTCGLGGGTGTGAAPIVAELARDIGALTVAVVTRPFAFEGAQRKQVAERGLAELTDKVDTIITIPNDKILQVIEKKTSILDAFMVVDEVLRQGVQGISELITIPGLINVDFNDVKAVMSGAGSALMGIGQASGENKAIEAAKMAINSPLLEMSIEGARGILFTIVGGAGLTMHEVNEAAKIITSSADEDAKIIFGAVIDPKFKDEIKITVVATGFNGAKRPVGTSSVAPDRSYNPTPFIEEGGEEIRPASAKSKASALKIAQAEPAAKKPGLEEEEDDELSIPTFIRKKMM